MIIYIDIDNTICNLQEGSLDYATVTPIVENIRKANKLYDAGNTIVYWTARGHRTGIDWELTTLEQFEKWGVKFHELKFNKPYDLIIDDKAMNVKDWK